MKYQAVFITSICGFATFSHATPVSPNLTAPSDIALDFNNTEATENHLLPRSNFCSPTGPKHCNLWLKSWIPPLTTGWLREWKVFDSNCKEIGGEKSLPVDGPYVLRNHQLPHPIDLDIQGGFEPAGYLRYDGHEVKLKPGWYCESCSGLSAARCCRTAFQCR